MHEDASREKYAYLDHLSTGELESLLRAGILAEDSSDPEMMDYLLEVIVKRETENGHMPDLNEAREDFERLYRGLEDPLYPCEEPERTPPLSATGRKRLRRVLAAAVLAAILIALTCVPVFGHASVVQMVASWTAEQFRFQIADDPGNAAQQSNQQLPEEYQELQTVLEERGIQLSVPDFPEGFVAEDPLLYVDTATENIEFSIMYLSDTDYIGFNLTQNGGLSFLAYEKNDSEIEQYDYAGVTHYIFKNTGTTMAAWEMDDFGYCIFTNSPAVKLKDIIQSTHKE